MQHKFKVHIAKLDSELYFGEAESLTVPTENGEITVLANHTPIIAKLRPGKLRLKDADKNIDFDIEKGVLEFSQNTANVLIFN